MRRQRFARASESAEAVKALTRRAEKVPGLEQVHSRLVMDQVRGVWTGQDRKPEEHAKASESAMAAMD